jgi:hypothetical protein
MPRPPKFEVPAETGLQGAPVGWVYREEKPHQVARPYRTGADRSPGNPIGMVATGLILVGKGTIGVLSLAVFGLMTAPIRIASAVRTRRL